jgi:S-adenosylmethionine hydrolase
MKKLIVIADWASDSVNCQEVRTAVEGFLKDSSVTPNITFVSSTPSTIHTSFITKQIIDIEERYGKPMETVIFQNTDPRIQTKKSVEKAKGAEFIVMRLKSGIYICGPNAGYDFSLIKDKIDEVYHYEGLDKGTQFRSRDLYSRVCAHLMDYMEDELDLTETPSNIIPEVEGFFVVHLDSYGNMKTNITKSSTSAPPTRSNRSTATAYSSPALTAT